MEPEGLLRAGVATLVLFVMSCGGSGGGTATPTAPTTPIAEPTVPALPPLDAAAFRVTVMLSASRVPTAEDVRRVFARANIILFEKTGEQMALVDLVTAGPGSPFVLASAYATANASAPPEGVIVFSDDAVASSLGGYSGTFPLPPPTENRFPSPNTGTRYGYLAVADFFHKYARCGYDGAGIRIGAVSSGGECRNRSGMTCVNNGRYWTCPDTLNDLYADPDYFSACTVVHEFMHPFGSEGNFDHYGTAQCIARTGMSQADAGNLRSAQQSCGMCPDVYQRFRHR